VIMQQYLVVFCFVKKVVIYFRLNYTFGPRVLTNSRNWSCPFKTEQSRPCVIIFVAFFVLPPIFSFKNADVSEF